MWAVPTTLAGRPLRPRPATCAKHGMTHTARGSCPTGPSTPTAVSPKAMASRTDWTAPHWEAVAAEQILLTPSLRYCVADRTVRVARSPHGGRKRLKSSTGRPIKTTGDVEPSDPSASLPCGSATPGILSLHTRTRCAGRWTAWRRRRTAEPLSPMILIRGSSCVI